MTTSGHSSPTEYTGCVLVVDDNDQVRQMLSLALETAGFTVLEASTQLEAQLRLAHTRPDALVLDLQRSETDGLNLLTLVRARQSLADMPVVFLAGTGARDFRSQALNAGADWFGLRPVGMLELQQHVAKLIC
jgi:DNA-binding response OmpR family regulator